MTTSSTNNSSTLRIGVLAGIGPLDPREMGDTITGLVLGQIFEMAYRLTPSGAIEPHLFAEPLRQERAGAQPVYSAAVPGASSSRTALRSRPRLRPRRSRKRELFAAGPRSRRAT